MCRTLGVMCLSLTLLPTSAGAATRYVLTSGNNVGNGTCNATEPCATLAHAVSVATDGDTIEVGTGTFVEQGGVFVDKDLHINGAGIFRTWVTASTPWAPSRVLTISSKATVRITSMQIQNGEADLGGGIRNHGSLELEDVWVRNNRADEGSGIYNDGILTLRHVEIALNDGDGFLNSPGDLAIVSQSRIVANDGTGIRNFGVLYMRESVVAVNGPWDGEPSLVHAGIHNELGGMALTNVTISGNDGIGLHVIRDATAILTHVTVTDNSGGLIADQNGEVELWNTIVSGNRIGDCLTDGGFVHGDGNLVASECLSPSWPGNNIVGMPAVLGPLAPNGFHLWTHALRDGSPAIDAGLGESCESLDQRGVTRPLDGDGDGVALCDIGAYERSAGRVSFDSEGTSR